MKRHTLVCALGVLRQRSGHKALMDGRLLGEHRPLRDTSSTAAAASTSLQLGPDNRCHNPGVGQKTNGTDGEESWEHCLILCNIKGKELVFCWWRLYIGSSWGWDNVLWAVLLLEVICFHFLGKLWCSFFFSAFCVTHVGQLSEQKSQKKYVKARVI